MHIIGHERTVSILILKLETTDSTFLKLHYGPHWGFSSMPQNMLLFTAFYLLLLLSFFFTITSRLKLADHFVTF